MYWTILWMAPASFCVYSEHAVRDLTAGARISHFEILQKVGEGGMGVVYKARDLRLDRFVALKVLSEKSVASPERRRRLVHEAKAASALNHANIVTVHEIDTVEDVTFIVMEFVEGKTLDRLIPRNGMRLADAFHYAVPIAEAFAAAHALGMVHRDLKPANIMVSESGNVKVLDFGLAKFFSGSDTPHAEAVGEATLTVTTAPQTEEGTVAGTVAYMSPEQAEGRKVDARSDIFAFGITLYEMLTGRRPFVGETRVSTMAAIVKDQQAPVRQLVPGLPAELERVLTRCLRKDPARRFQTMADLRVALEEVKEESESGSVAATAAKLASRPRLPWLWVIAAAAVAVAAMGAWMLTRGGPAALPMRVVSVTTSPGSEQEPSVSPDGKQVAFSWDGDRGGNFEIYVKIIGENNALRLTTDSSRDSYPAWSPDGKRIAFHSPSGIYTVSPLGGAEQRLSSLRVNGQMSWSPDGKWLAVAAGGRGSTAIFLLPADGRDPRQISRPVPPGSHQTPSFSPDGRWLVYGACTARFSCGIVIQSLDSGYTPQGSAQPVTHETLESVGGLAWGANGRWLAYVSGFTEAPFNYLWRVEVPGGHMERLDIAGPMASAPAIDSSGKRILFSRAYRDIDIWKLTLGAEMEPVIVSSATDQEPAYSPDGSRIAFNSDRSGETPEIWVAAADGSNPVQLTRNVGRFQGSPKWSPDGRWIAFDSQGNDGRWDVWVVEAGGGRPRRITMDPSDENIPSWSRDGRWIYFRSDRNGRSEIWRMPFQGGPAEQMSSDGGNTALESVDGRTLYYTNADSSPLFAKPVAGGPEHQVLPSIYRRCFEPAQDGIYYVSATGDDGKLPVLFFEFATGASRLLGKVNPSPRGLGFAVSPDRKTVLFTRNIRDGADLMMIENFR